MAPKSPYSEQGITHLVSKLKGGVDMKHKIKISVAKESPKDGVVMCKKKRMKRSLYKRLFGTNPDKVTIIIPGDSVEDVTIQEVARKGGIKGE